MRKGVLAALVFFVGACGADDEKSPFAVQPGPPQVVDSTGMESTGDITPVDSSTGSTDDASSGSGGAEESTTGTTQGPSPVCGDGQVDEGEACDDGNADDSDACLSSCKAATCGDSIVQQDVEECDGISLGGQSCETLGLPTGQLSCTDACKLDSSGCNGKCGDGQVDEGEECDDGNMSDNDTCLNTCQLATCGDGVQQSGAEECDDGNKIDTDACLSSCKVATCGDSIVQEGVEECDDGQNGNNDACTNACMNNVCGDGLWWIGVEVCDDGNQIDDDFCNNACDGP